MLDMIYEPDPILHQKSQAISKVTSDIRELIAEMKDAVEFYRGAGLAAPQIGHSVRLFVWRSGEGAVMVAVNPLFRLKSKVLEHGEEMCLSLPDFKALIPRHKWVEMSALNEQGHAYHLRLEDFEARVVQHEMDHLNGKLIADYISITE